MFMIKSIIQHLKDINPEYIYFITLVALFNGCVAFIVSLVLLSNW